MSEEIIIDGVNVAGCEHLTEIKGCWLSTCDYLPYKGNITNQLCKYNDNCYYKQFKRLQEENEKIKKQYNCYACGNCNGKEDYINLEKHHKGLRKQFDELAKRNNILSLRIEELEKENEELKEKVNIYENSIIANHDRAVGKRLMEVLQALEEIKNLAELEVMLDKNSKAFYQANIQRILDKINEVLNEKP